MIYETSPQTPVITYPEKPSAWEERFEAWQWHSEADGGWQNLDVRGGVNHERVSLRRAFRKPFRLEAPEREERKALLEMTGGSEATLRGTS